MSDQTEAPAHTIPVNSFIKSLRGTPDEVYSRLLIIEHRFQNKTMAEWHETLHGHRGLTVETSAAPPDDVPHEGT
jgi:hypothetical protein